MGIADYNLKGEQKNNIAYFASIVKLALSDSVITEAEEKLINRLAKRFHIMQEMRNEIMENPAEFSMVTPHSYNERIEQLFLLSKMIYADEVDERNINPWLEMWRTEFNHAASEIRDFAIQDIAIEENIDGELNALADALDEVATFRMYMGCGEEFDELTTKATDLARRFKEARIDTIPLGKEAVNQIRDIIVSSSRKLNNLIPRIEDLIHSGRIEDLQSEVSDIGHTILKVSYYNLQSLGLYIGDSLRSIGRKLHLVDTVRLYLDGGASLRAMTEAISRVAEDLESIVENIQTIH